MREDVSEEDESLPLGGARIAREGDGVTVDAYGRMLQRVLEAAETVGAEDGIEPEVIDLMTVSPMDTETLVASARKTGRVVAHEAAQTCGIGAEVAARVQDKAFLQLEAPIRRVTGLDIPFPGFARERAWTPDVGRVLRAIRETAAF
jgi:pyruvate dehydrogenase E1 component beta subunit